MKVRRFPPLAIAIALVAAALVATTWATSRTVDGAFVSVRDGQAFAAEQAVRADLNELDGPPSPQDLVDIVTKRSNDGLRYLALLDGRGRVAAESGHPFGGPRAFNERRALDVQYIRGRIRIDMRMNYRRGMVGLGPRLQWIALELEPVEADALRSSSRRTLAIAAIGALTLLGVAIAVTRRELRRSADEAGREREKRLASLGEMSAVLAHEIRNPLASLKGNAQLLAAMLPQGEKVRAKADRVVDEAVRLEKLMQDLLAFVRTGQIARAPTSPAQIAREAAGAVAQPDAVTVDDRAAPPMWSLDAGRLREVLVNLVDNAVAAGPPVWVRVAVEQGRLVFEVIDRGPGVPAADRDKIFEPFFTGKTRGTGLGLAIAKRLVELHHGTIAVGDVQGGGARFRIEIPEA